MTFSITPEMVFSVTSTTKKEFTEEQWAKFFEKFYIYEQKSYGLMRIPKRVKVDKDFGITIIANIKARKTAPTTAAVPSIASGSSSLHGPFTHTHFHFHSKDEVVEFFKKPALYSGLTHFSVSAYYHKDAPAVWELYESYNLSKNYKYDSSSEIFVDAASDSYLPVRLRVSSFSKKKNC